MAVWMFRNYFIKRFQTQVIKLFCFCIALCLLFAPQPAMAGPKQAQCLITSGAAVDYKGKCTFTPEGKGSFTISAANQSDDVFFQEIILVSVTITSKGEGEVRGLTTAGINSRWGPVVRSKTDGACWNGEDFQICVW